MTDIILIVVWNLIFDWLRDWAEVISGLGSLVLSAGLLYLYFQQTTILEQQRNLRIKELNHEVRQNHTETLRKRVRMWHGDPDREQPEIRTGSDIGLDSDLNIPRVTATSIEPAPAEIEVVPRDDTFRVVPAKLEGDRYLQDLLQNHAPDLRESKNSLEELEKEINELRDEFIKEYDEGAIIEHDAYVVEPLPYFSEWLLDQVIRVERGYRDDFEEVMEIIEDGIENAAGYARPEEGKVFIPLRDREQGVFQATATTGDLGSLDEYREQIHERVLEVVEQAFEEIMESPSYTTATTISKRLDDAAKEVKNLENLLVKYEGQQIYPHDCPYIEEASITEED